MKELDEQHTVTMDERIDKFLTGRTSSDEEKAFKEDLKNDEVLRHRTKEVVALIKGIKDFGKSEDQKVIDAVKNHKQARIIKISPRVWSPVALVAASVACFLINSHLIYNNSINYGIGESNALISDVQSSNRSISDPELGKRLVLLFSNAQQGKDIESTIASLQELYNISRDDNVDEVDDYSSRIGWFLAIAYLQDGQKEKAIEVLKQVVADNPNAEQAKILLQKLDRTFFWE